MDFLNYFKISTYNTLTYLYIFYPSKKAIQIINSNFSLTCLSALLGGGYWFESQRKHGCLQQNRSLNNSSCAKYDRRVPQK